MLELVVPGLISSLQALHAREQAQVPALMMLQARSQGEPTEAESVEDLVCRRHGLAKQADWPLAALTYEFDGGRAGSDYWLRADPVHVEVQRDKLMLTDKLDIADDEAHALCHALAAHFGDQLAPLAMHPSRWYLRVPADPAITTTPLSHARGRAIESLLPHGPGAPGWHKLLNEAQMLLFDHPVNQAREKRHAKPINSLWLWGGGTLPPAPVWAPRHGDFYGSDFTSRAIAKFANAAVHPLPQQWQPVIGDRALCLMDELARSWLNQDVGAWEAALERLESGWIGPLIKAGMTYRVTDPEAGVALRWRPFDRWKFWRRPARSAPPPIDLVAPPSVHPTMDEFGNRY